MGDLLIEGIGAVPLIEIVLTVDRQVCKSATQIQVARYACLNLNVLRHKSRGPR